MKNESMNQHVPHRKIILGFTIPRSVESYRESRLSKGQNTMVDPACACEADTGSHDDLVIATALAAWERNQPSSLGRKAIMYA